MASIAGQLILALAADWLCHKINPTWQERREFRRAHVHVLQSFRRAAEAQRNVAQAMRSLEEAARNTTVEIQISL